MEKEAFERIHRARKDVIDQMKVTDKKIAEAVETIPMSADSLWVSIVNNLQQNRLSQFLSLLTLSEEESLLWLGDLTESSTRLEKSSKRLEILTVILAVLTFVLIMKTLLP